LLVAASIGLIGGAVAGASVSAALALGVFYPLWTPEAGLLLPLTVHGGIWGAIGAVGGLALALGLNDRRLALHTLLGGLVGAVAGTLAFEIFNATVYPLIKVETLVPSERYARLAAHLCVAVAAATGAATGVMGDAKRRTP
jgi:hypothetical protein